MIRSSLILDILEDFTGDMKILGKGKVSWVAKNGGTVKLTPKGNKVIVEVMCEADFIQIGSDLIAKKYREVENANKGENNA